MFYTNYFLKYKQSVFFVDLCRKNTFMKSLKNINKQHLKQFFYQDILGSKDSAIKKSLSIALGVFVGISPFWGFQTVLAISIALVFKLNKTFAFLFSNISFPLFIPFILYASMKAGSFFVKDTTIILNFDITLNDVKKNLTQYFIGSFVLALVLAIIFGFIGFLFFVIKDRKTPKKT